MAKKINHSLRMMATDPDGKECAIDVFHEWDITKGPDGKDVVKSGPAYHKTSDGQEAVKLGDGKFKIVATGVELTLKGPLFVTKGSPTLLDP